MMSMPTGLLCLSTAVLSARAATLISGLAIIIGHLAIIGGLTIIGGLSSIIFIIISFKIIIRLLSILFY